MENVDDDAFLWLGSPGATEGAICSARLSVNGGNAQCDLGAILAGLPLDFSAVPFTLKLGNGGGFNTQGVFYLSINGVEAELSRQLPVIAHTGWTHRQQFTVDFVAGTYVASPPDACVTIFDCLD